MRLIPPSKKTKVLMSKEAPGKDAPPMAAPMKVTPQEAPSGEGRNKQRDKVVSQSYPVGYVDSQVCVDGTNAQLFYRGALYPTVAKEIYTTPSEALLDNVAKNLVMQHHHLSMGLINKVRDSERVVDELSKIIDELQGEVHKLNKEAGLIIRLRVPTPWSRVPPPREETSGFKLGLEKTGWVSNKYGFKVALPRFWARYSQLEIKEDPYANLPEDDNVSMEAEVPFDDNDPPTHRSPSEEPLASLPRFFCNWPS
ncbi:hypothetical protein B296_00000769 [Ensete ventricosum]|uniref:Uncharacterized protein n=1 Tax=Ensete ventricosum TaxID=4639 RepID=A0A427B9G3_ENSVE|nr:hypothetical protein B296_00000769 [Ensete ventricosum]